MYNIESNPLLAFAFLSKCFSDSVETFDINGYTIDNEIKNPDGTKVKKQTCCFDDKINRSIILDCISKTTKQVKICFCNNWSTSTIEKIFKTSAHLQEMVFYFCDFRTKQEIILNFENTPATTALEFIDCKLGKSVEKSKILKAIWDSELTASLEMIKFEECDLKVREIKVFLKTKEIAFVNQKFEVS